MRADVDNIAVVERAYRLDGALDVWLERVRRALAPLVDQGLGVSMGTWALEDGRLQNAVECPGDVSADLFGALKQMVAALPPEFVAERYGPDAREFVGSAHRFLAGYAQVSERVLAPRGLGHVRDMLGAFVFGNPGRNGVVLNAFSERPVALAAPQRRRLVRLLTHVSAGFRLRLHLSRAAAPGEAVLTPSGTLLHAEEEAAGADHRAALETAVRNTERARGRLRQTRPEEALALWKGLVAGRWSIVDWVDTDGRRYLVAHANAVSARDPRALSPRELDVAEFVVQGRSTPEIAYALGLAEGTVTRQVRAVLRKFGAARRSDVAGLFGDVAPFRASLPGVRDATVLTPGSNQALWRRLSDAERAVVEQVLAGQTAARVAAARGVSVKTVNNQLGAVYARFGVRGKTELATLLGRPP